MQNSLIWLRTSMASAERRWKTRVNREWKHLVKIAHVKKSSIVESNDGLPRALFWPPLTRVHADYSTLPAFEYRMQF
jgi:hypothetical protein